MLKRKIEKHRRHITVYVSIGIFIGFFWVMPMLLNGPRPAEIVGEGLNNITETYLVIVEASKIFNTTSAEIVTAIGGISAIAYAIWSLKRK